MKNLDSPGRLVIGGANEAVLEVLMSMRQALYLQIDRTSAEPTYMLHGVGPGEDLSIRPYTPSPIQDSDDTLEINTSLDSYEMSSIGLSRRPGHTLFECSFTSCVKSDLMKAISAHHPEVMFFTDFTHHGSARCWTGGRKSQAVVPAGFGTALDEKMGNLPPAIVDALHELIASIVARSPAIRGADRPRWSELTHAAHRAGVDGLLQAVASSPLTSLHSELRLAQAERRSSWLDALMFGDYGSDAGAAIYPTACQEQWAHQQRLILQHLHDCGSAGRPLDQVSSHLADVLSDPSATLQSGLLPIAFLASSAQSDGASRPHLMRVVQDLTVRLTRRLVEFKITPTQMHLASAVCALVSCHGRHGTAALAVAAGLSAGTVHRTIDVNGEDAWTPEQAQRLMSTYTECFGSPSDFPDDLVRAVRGSDYTVQAALDRCMLEAELQAHLSRPTRLSDASRSRAGPSQCAAVTRLDHGELGSRGLGLACRAGEPCSATH